MRLPDFWTGLAFAALGISIAVMARGLPAPAGAASPRLFPTLIGGGMAVLGAAIAVRGLRTASDFTWPEWVGHPRRLALMAYLPAAIVVFALVAPIYGTIAVAVPIIVIHSIIYGLRPISALAIGVTAGVAIPMVFTNLLGIPLPYGVIEGMF